MADKTVTYRLAADITAFQAKMAQASASVKKFANDSTAATKESNTFRQGLTTFGSAAGKVGLVAAAGLGAAVLAAANFDAAMSKVQAATGESAANMDKLRDAAIQAGQRTVFSASEAASGIEELAKAGVSTADILNGGLNGALDLAAAGSISVSEAAETAASAMTQFGQTGSDVPHIADLLAAAASSAQGEVSDFGAALNQSGLVAGQMGVSIEEATGSLAAFASAGLTGSDAGTSFKQALLRLANPSTEAAKQMDKLGISAYDAQGNFVGMAEIAGQLQEAFKGQSQETRDAALATIFGSDAIRVANVLYKQGEAGINGWTNRVNDSGAAAEMAATKLDNLKGDLEQFKGSLETALIGTGEGAQGPLRGIVQGLTAVVNAYNKLPSGAQGGIAGALGLTALTGGALYGLSRAVTFVSNLREALDKLPPTASKAAGAIKAIGTAAIGLEILSVASDGIDSFVRSFDKAAPNMDRLARNLENIGDQNAVAGLRDELGDLGGALDDVDGKFSNALATSQQWLDKIPLVGNTAANQFDWVPGVAGQVRGLREATATFNSLDEALTGLGENEGPQRAKRVFDQLARSYDLSASETQKLMAQLPQFSALLEDTGNVGSSAGKSLANTLASGLNQTAGAMDRAASAGRSLKDVLAELAGFFDKRAALRDYQAALDDFGKTLKRNGANFDRTTEKGRETEASLDRVGTSALQVADKMKRANKVEFLRRTASDIESAARDMGVLQNKDIQGVIDKLRETARTSAKPKVDPQGIPQANKDLDGVGKHLDDVGKKHPTPTVKVVDNASSVIRNILGGLNNLPQSKTVTITTNHVTHYVQTGRPQGGGGYSTDEHLASGGYVSGPGTSTSDSIPARLSNGEYVVRAAAVQRYGTDMLHAINAMRFAQGGFVGSPNVTVNPNVSAVASLSDVDVARIAAAVRAGSAAGTAAGISGREKAGLAGRRT